MKGIESKVENGCNEQSMGRFANPDDYDSFPMIDAFDKPYFTLRKLSLSCVPLELQYQAEITGSHSIRHTK